MVDSVYTVKLTLLNYLLVISSLALVVLNYRALSVGKSLCSETFLWELNFFLSILATCQMVVLFFNLRQVK